MKGNPNKKDRGLQFNIRIEQPAGWTVDMLSCDHFDLENSPYKIVPALKKEKRIVEVLAAFYHQVSEPGRYLAINALSKIDRASARYFLIRLLSDSAQPAGIRRHAIAMLGISGPHSIVPTLLNLARTEIEEDILREIVYVLGYHLSKTSISFLISQLDDKTLPDWVRATAAESLCKADTDLPKPVRNQAVKALLIGLQDSVPLVRFFSVRSLGQIGGKRDLKALATVAHDDTLCDFAPDGGKISDEVAKAKKWILEYARRKKRARKTKTRRTNTQSSEA